MTSPWNSYRQVATQTAQPGQLVLMLFDGAIRFLERALLGFEHTDPLEFNVTINNNLLRALAIINELNASLDTDQGGEFAANQRRLYNYMEWRLQQSNLRKHKPGIVEIIGILGSLREAWAQMLKQQAAGGEASTNRPSVMAMG